MEKFCLPHPLEYYLPREENGKKYFSNSQFKASACLAGYHGRYIENLVTQDKYFLHEGKVYDNAINYWIEKYLIDGVVLPHEEICEIMSVDFFDTADEVDWFYFSKGERKEYDPQVRFDLMSECLKYYMEVAPGVTLLPKVVSVQKKMFFCIPVKNFQGEIEPINIMVILDIELKKSIVDNKYYGQTISKVQPDDGIQLELYAMAAKANGMFAGFDPKLAAYYSIKSKRETLMLDLHEYYGDHIIELFGDRIRAVALARAFNEWPRSHTAKICNLTMCNQHWDCMGSNRMKEE